MNAILKIFGIRKTMNMNKDEKSSNSITITKNDMYIGITTMALFALYFWQRILSRRHPPPVPKKELPARPALRILFQPDNDISAPSPPRSPSSPPSLYSPSSQQRRQHGHESDPKQGNDGILPSSTDTENIDTRTSISGQKRVGKDTIVDERPAKTDNLRTIDNAAQAESVNKDGLRSTNVPYSAAHNELTLPGGIVVGGEVMHGRDVTGGGSK